MPPKSLLQQVQRAAALLMAGTLAASALGFLKSLLIANYYGTSAGIDAYMLALAPCRLLIGILVGTLQVSLIPRYLALKEQRGAEDACAFLATCAVWMLAFSAAIFALFYGAARPLARYLGQGFTPPFIELTADMLKISAIFLTLSLLAALTKGVLHAQREFLLIGVAPILNAVCSIGYVLWYHERGVAALLESLIVGIGVELALTGAWARRRLPARVRRLPMLGGEMRGMLRAIWPLLVSSSLANANLFVDQVMASALPAGSIAALNYAVKLHGTINQIFIMALSQAILPFFAQCAAERDWPRMKQTFSLTNRRVCLGLIPLAVLIGVFGHQIVAIVFQRGAFTADSTAATANAWIVYAFGLPMQAMTILLARVYNALEDNKTLMGVSVGSVLSNVLFNAIFMSFWGHVGIAASTTVVSLFTCAALFGLLRRKPEWAARS